MVKDKLFLIGYFVGLMLGMTIMFFISRHTGKANELAECYEDYARLAKLDDKLFRIEKGNFEYRLQELQEDLNKCQEGKK